jgi:hypothetical protein
MFIKRVVLDNLRGFRHLDFDFERPVVDPNPAGPARAYAGWAVITGDNAAGKTALLKAIALALVGTDTARALQPSLHGWIRREVNEAVIAVEIVAGEEDKFAQGRRYEHPFWSELKLLADPGPEVTLSVGDKYKGKGKGPKHGPWAENPTGWYAVGYGPFRRLYGASPDAQRMMVGPSRVARFATMFREDATLGECEIWLKDLHVKKLEQRDRESRILDQVLQMLNDDFLRNGLRIEKVDSEGLWLRDAGDIVLPLADMSEGYRAALALLVDIVRHMVDVFGPENLVQAHQGRLVIPHSGVVLIDEIDSHLHPEWQRQIGFWFKERFPNIQFIVTTHSAMICQAADEDLIYHLPPPGSLSEPNRITGDEYWKIVKSKPDVILLSPAFGMQHTRSPRAVQARNKHAELKAKKHAGKLSEKENEQMQGLLLFTDDDEGENHASDRSDFTSPTQLDLSRT